MFPTNISTHYITVYVEYLVSTNKMLTLYFATEHIDYNKDIGRKLRNFYGKLNILIKNIWFVFICCKFQSFMSYCSPMYTEFVCCDKKAIPTIRDYNNDFRRLLWVMINTIVLAPCLLKTLLMNSMGVYGN